MAHPDEAMQRTGDAIAGDGDVRPVDPVDIDRLDDRLAEIGAVRGVFVLYNYHCRVGLNGADRPAAPDVHGATRRELGRAKLSR